MGDGGFICLRAITTALLAIYDINNTSAVLGRIIPESLINYDLGDGRIIADCPFSSSIWQFLAAVSMEEQTNILRKDLWRRVDEEFKRMLSVTVNRFDIQDMRKIEVSIVIGLLQWVLINPAKRATTNYPTLFMIVCSR